MKVTLIGQAESKRTQYFLKAAAYLGQEIAFMTYDEICIDKLEETMIKIDPPQYESCYVEELPRLIEGYEGLLRQLQEKEQLTFFNHPRGLLETLDKSECKKKLQEANIPVTPFLTDGITSLIALKALLKSKKVYQVFIKPNKGSGACGVIAYRFHPSQGQEIAYTALTIDKGRLINTKKMRKLIDSETISTVCDGVLQQGAIVEVWLPKATYKGMSYDLRVVYQFGKIAYTVARQSSSPITNLHLNNQALKVEKLNLPQHTLTEIEELCEQVMGLYDTELSYAGIDVLIEKNTFKPYIIEINGQGDLLYQDIYNDNLIYKMQLMEGAKYAR